MSTLSPQEEFSTAFDPKSYLSEYFCEPDDEDRFAMKFMATVLRGMPDNLLVLEFGGGPTLYSVAMLVSKAREIHFSDYVEDSLKEVRLWLDEDPDAFDWYPYIKLACKEENGVTTHNAVTQRSALIRQRVTRLMLCDARVSKPLGSGAVTYDFVAAHHCTDVAAATVSEWKQIIKNVSTLVADAGWLLVSVTTGTRKYTVGEKVFPCVDLTVEDIRHGFLGAGFDPESFYYEEQILNGDQEYSGIIMAIARKFR